MRIIVLTKGDQISDMIISGTIHASPLRPTTPIHEIEKALRGQPIDKALFEARIGQVLSREGFHIAKVSPELLAEKTYDCASS